VVSVFIYYLVSFFVLARYGIVALIGMQLLDVFSTNVVVLDTSRPGFAIALAVSLIPIALAIYAFHISRAGRPLFTRDLLKDFK